MTRNLNLLDLLDELDQVCMVLADFEVKFWSFNTCSICRPRFSWITWQLRCTWLVIRWASLWGVAREGSVLILPAYV